MFTFAHYNRKWNYLPTLVLSCLVRLLRARLHMHTCVYTCFLSSFLMSLLHLICNYFLTSPIISSTFNNYYYIKWNVLLRECRALKLAQEKNSFIVKHQDQRQLNFDETLELHSSLTTNLIIIIIHSLILIPTI